MRKTINDNPIAQVAILGVLALAVGVLLITRMSHKSSTSSTDTTSASVTATTTSDAGAVATTPDASATVAPDAATGAVAPTAPAPDAAAQAAAAGEFVVGPGLPGPVVRAYAQNKVVVLLVIRRKGIDDEAVKTSVERMSGASNVALFVTNAGHVSRYSRIAAGVDLDRVPALIVLRPRKLTNGTPVATVSYGFRSADSVAQAVQDALYKGPTDLPSYPK